MPQRRRSWSPSSAVCAGVSPVASPGMPCKRSSKRRRPRSTPAAPSTPSATPSGRSRCPRTIRRQRQLLLVRATAELEQRQFAEASADAQRGARWRARRRRQGARRVEARRRLGTIAQMQGDLRDCPARARRPRSSCSAAVGDQRRLANALRARGFAEVFGGSLDDARTYPRRGDGRSSTSIDDERGHAWTHQNLAWVAFQSGDFDDAEVQLIEARERFEELGDRNGVQLGGGPAGLRVVLPAPIRRGRGAGRRRSRPTPGGGATRGPALMMQTLLANLRLWTGRLAEAEQLAERALAGFREINDRYGMMQALGPLNRARAGLGKKADAKRGVEESISPRQGVRRARAWRCRARPGVAMHLGDGRAGVDARRAGDRAPPGDWHVARRGAGAAGAGPMPGRATSTRP